MRIHSMRWILSWKNKNWWIRGIRGNVYGSRFARGRMPRYRASSKYLRSPCRRRLYDAGHSRTVKASRFSLFFSVILSLCYPLGWRFYSVLSFFSPRWLFLVSGRGSGKIGGNDFLSTQVFGHLISLGGGKRRRMVGPGETPGDVKSLRIFSCLHHGADL